MVTIELTQRTHFDLIDMITEAQKVAADNYQNFEKELKDPNSYLNKDMDYVQIANLQYLYDQVFELYPRVIRELRDGVKDQNDL